MRAGWRNLIRPFEDVDRSVLLGPARQGPSARPATQPQSSTFTSSRHFHSWAASRLPHYQRGQRHQPRQDEPQIIPEPIGQSLSVPAMWARSGHASVGQLPAAFEAPPISFHAVALSLDWLGVVTEHPSATTSTSVPPEQQVHHPATPDMLTRLATVLEDVLVGTVCVFESVGQNGHTVEGTVGVDCLGKVRDGGRERGRVDGHGAYWSTCKGTRIRCRSPWSEPAPSAPGAELLSQRGGPDRSERDGGPAPRSGDRTGCHRLGRSKQQSVTVLFETQHARATGVAAVDRALAGFEVNVHNRDKENAERRPALWHGECPIQCR
jgi:hypothetical protein